MHDAARPIDRLVRAAQRGDARALDELLGLVRPSLLRFAGRIAPRDAGREDAVQEALHDIARGIDSYRWQSSFLSWCYAICARRVARVATRTARELERIEQQLEAAVLPGEAPADDREAVVADQDLHLACALVVATGLTETLRRAYLYGDVLDVTDLVGAELCGCTPAAFRQRVSRARRLVADQIRDGLVAAGSPVADPEWTDELDRLVRLGDLHRAQGRRAAPTDAGRAAMLAAPRLLSVDGPPPATEVPSRTEAAR